MIYLLLSKVQTQLIILHICLTIVIHNKKRIERVHCLCRTLINENETTGASNLLPPSIYTVDKY
jgi:hypothetical protein